MYYLWLDNAQAGPFTLAQLTAQWQAGRITTLTLYWEPGNADWLPLHNIAGLLDPPASLHPPTIPPVPSPAPGSLDPASPVPSRPPALFPLSPPASRIPASPSGSLGPFTREFQPPAVSASAAPQPSSPTLPPPPAASPEEILFDEHPSLWNFAGSLFWGVILTPVIIGILILIHLFWSRAATRYQVTRRRVSLTTGIFSRTSRELRIEDIRSIAARANLFGIGDIEFSTAARADAEVVFRGISHVERVRDLVKQLQNGLR